ncbi:acyltransferase [Candidatus Microgenomates bacterium]|nr:acyltransferase [Candidatus Microgenomates bacterium]
MSAIDLLKIIAVVAVVIIHSVSAYRFSPSFTGDATWLTIIDQAMRFSVPLFVALSGFGLMLGYGQKKLDLISYFRRRVWRLLPWYLFFATVIILAVTFLWHENTALYGSLKLWRLYIFGQADYHLYFIPMILSLYLLFPIILFFFRKLPPLFLVVLAFFWQLFWFYLIGQKTELAINNNGLWPYQEQYRHAASWIFYFVLGMFLAGKKAPRWQFIVGSTVAIFGLFFSVSDSLALLSKGINIIVATRFTRLPILVFATGIILVGHYVITHFSAVSRSRWGQLSYVVYLLHTLVIRTLFRTPDLVPLLGFGVTTMVAVGGSFLIAGIMVRITKR